MEIVRGGSVAVEAISMFERWQKVLSILKQFIGIVLWKLTLYKKIQIAMQFIFDIGLKAYEGIYKDDKDIIPVPRQDLLFRIKSLKSS